MPEDVSRLRVIWDAPAKPNGVVEYYIIEQQMLQHGSCVEETKAWSLPDEVEGSIHEIILHDLLPYSLYAVRLYAGTSAGRGSPVISVGRTAASGSIICTEIIVLLL